MAKRKSKKTASTETSLAPITVTRQKATGLSSEVLEHLHTIAVRDELNVLQFRDYTGCGKEAASLLKGYEKAGLIRSIWKTSKTFFALTEKGKQHLANQNL